MANVNQEKRMYDTETKQQFVAEYSSSASSRKLVESIFYALCEYEERWGVDVALFNVEQAQEAVNSVSWFRSNNSMSMLYILKKYIRWRKERQLPASDSLSSVVLDAAQKYRSRMVGNPQHLLLSLNAAFPHPESNEIEYIYRSFLWLAFLGFDDDEAIRVRQDEVNFDAMRVDFAGSIIPHPIYPEALKDLRKAVTLTAFKEPRGKCGTIKERMPGNEILRGKLPEKPMDVFLERTLRPMVSRAFSKAMQPYASGELKKPESLSLELSYLHIYLSGIFYRAYEGERIGLSVNFYDIIMHETRDIGEDDERFGRNYTLNKRRNAIARGYLRDYEAWKCAFAMG